MKKIVTRSVLLIAVEHWDDLLWESEDYNKSRDRILERINRLLEELKSKQ